MARGDGRLAGARWYMGGLGTGLGEAAVGWEGVAETGREMGGGRGGREAPELTAVLLMLASAILV